jgi:hypothetical protein
MIGIKGIAELFEETSDAFLQPRQPTHTQPTLPAADRPKQRPHRVRRKGRVRLTHRADALLPDPLVVQVVREERADRRQRLRRLRNQRLEAHFHRVRAAVPYLLAAPSQHPFPVEARPQDTRRAGHRRRLPRCLLSQRTGDVTAIAHDVQEQRVRNGLLDLIHVQQVVGRTIRPARHLLLVGDAVHQQPQQLARRPAPLVDRAPERDLIQSRAPEPLGRQPGVEQSGALTRRPEIAEPWREPAEDSGAGHEQGKAASRQQQVIEPRRSRARSADDEHRRHGASGVGHQPTLGPIAAGGARLLSASLSNTYSLQPRPPPIFRFVRVKPRSR